MERDEHGRLRLPRLWRHGRDGHGHASNIPIGTIIVDLVNPKTHEMVWRGTAQDQVSTAGASQGTITQAMQTIFKNFPPASVSEHFTAAGRSPGRLLFLEFEDEDRMNRKLLAGFLALGLFALASAAGAQQLIIKGEFGMKAGTMPDPGLYVGMFGNINWAGRDQRLDNATIHGPKLTQEIFGPLIKWVSPYKILGANYASSSRVPFANVRAEFPASRRPGRLDGPGALRALVVPVAARLAHQGSAAALRPAAPTSSSHYTFYAPTGRYTPGALDNTSLGMWCNELSGRVTAYFDKDRDWPGRPRSSTTSTARSRTRTGRPGNAFTFMGGLGRNWGDKDTLLSGWVGIAGYGQWQTTATTGVDAPLAARLNGESRVYSIGPELTALEGALTLRYFWEYGGEVLRRRARVSTSSSSMPIGK